MCVPIPPYAGGSDLTLQEVNRVSEVVSSLADPACNIIFGAVIDDRYHGEIHVTIIATGRWALRRGRGLRVEYLGVPPERSEGAGGVQVEDPLILIATTGQKWTEYLVGFPFSLNEGPSLHLLSPLPLPRSCTPLAHVRLSLMYLAHVRLSLMYVAHVRLSLMYVALPDLGSDFMSSHLFLMALPLSGFRESYADLARVPTKSSKRLQQQVNEVTLQ